MGQSILGGSKQKSSSTPQDMTPPEFTALRSPVAAALLSLFQTGGPTYTTNPNIWAGQPTMANPAYSSLQQQISSFVQPSQARVSAPANRPGYTSVNDRGGGVRDTRPQPAAAPQAGAGTPGTTLADLQAQLAGMSPTMANPDFTGTSPLVAGMSPEEQALVQMIVGGAGGNALTGATSDQALATLRGDYLSPQSNPFLAAYIQAAQRPVTEQFNRTTVPNLLGRYTQAGQQIQGAGSTAFAGAANTAANDFTQSLSDISTRISEGAYNAERDRQTGMVGTANQISNDELQRLQKRLESAALPRLIQDLGIQRGIAEFNRRMQVIMDALKLASGVSAPTVANSQSSSGTSGNGIASLIPSLSFTGI